MKLSERIKAQTDERLAVEAKKHPLGVLSRLTPLPEVLAAFDELDARLAKLEDPQAPRHPMPPRPNPNATVTSTLSDGERVFLIHVKDRRSASGWHVIQVDQTTLIDLWNAIEAVS